MNKNEGREWAIFQRILAALIRVVERKKKGWGDWANRFIAVQVLKKKEKKIKE